MDISSGSKSTSRTLAVRPASRRDRDKQAKEIGKNASAFPTIRSTGATLHVVTRNITQRELRNDSGKIMRALDRGERFIVTRNGVPVAELNPIRRRVFVPKDELLEIFRGAPHIDFKQFRKDIDALVDQDPTPRAYRRR
ncbi:MAG: type II toxin-antitoxin system Phd/YefM family antitoxin [Chloroflexi bacterium]|nr:MAG: type II toxin-antitoxin system Phd/YefM family antitoxin [Chloroflexota bacterium]TME36004.1 MAG: type II toxin-antitoxin system Phd/YefM family antitoxin [Chloroflexota bacterium]